MSHESASGWEPITPSEGERWLLASGAVGWIERAPLDAREALRHEVAQLVAQRDALEAEIAAARSEGYEAGVAQGIASLQPWVNQVESQLAQTRTSLRERAVDTALVIAEVIVRGEVQANRLTISDVVDRALVGRTAAPTRILVAPNAVAPLQLSLRSRGILTTIAVAADPSLDDGDAVIEYPDGHIDVRVGALIRAFREDVAQELSDD